MQLKEVQIQATVRLPIKATKTQIDEWLKFNLGCANELSADNPLSDFDELDATALQLVSQPAN